MQLHEGLPCDSLMAPHRRCSPLKTADLHWTPGRYFSCRICFSLPILKKRHGFQLWPLDFILHKNNNYKPAKCQLSWQACPADSMLFKEHNAVEHSCWWENRLSTATVETAPYKHGSSLESCFTDHEWNAGSESMFSACHLSFYFRQLA